MIWPRFQGYLEGYWGTNPFKLHTEYLGAVPVLLALLALTARRSATVWFFAALAALGLLFAWGGATPLHRLFYWVLPMMKSFRAPAMMYSIVALAVVVLAGHGAQALYDRRAELADGSHVAWKVIGGLGRPVDRPLVLGGRLPRGVRRVLEGASLRGIARAGTRPGGRPRRCPGSPARSVSSRSSGRWARGSAGWRRDSGSARSPPVSRWRASRAPTCGSSTATSTRSCPPSRLVEPGPAVEWLQQQPEPFRALPLPGAFGPNDLMLFGIPTVTGSQNFRLRWWDDLVGRGRSPAGGDEAVAAPQPPIRDLGPADRARGTRARIRAGTARLPIRRDGGRRVAGARGARASGRGGPGFGGAGRLLRSAADGAPRARRPRRLARRPPRGRSRPRRGRSASPIASRSRSSRPPTGSSSSPRSGIPTGARGSTGSRPTFSRSTARSGESR